jgi:ubiquinone biosynthesis protein COQ4
MNIFSTAYHYIRVIFAIIGLNRNPQRTDLVFVVGNSLYKLGKFQAVHQIIQANPAALKVIAERKLISGFSLPTLAQLPPGQLGRVYADHMLGLNLNPDFFPRPAQINDDTFIMLRLRQTHDLWHVVTGFDTSVHGEIGLLSFTLAQMEPPLPMLLLGSAIIKTAIVNQGNLVPLMDAIVKGWKMGRSAKAFFPYEWENSWNMDLSLVRRELGIEH